MRFSLTVAQRTTQFGRRWRKRAGVEPTRGRVAAPTGFEGRPAHRDRFSSVGSFEISMDRQSAVRRKTAREVNLLTPGQASRMLTRALPDRTSRKILSCLRFRSASSWLPFSGRTVRHERRDRHGMKQNFTLAPAHAHLNLLGWVSMALYRAFLQVRARKCDRVAAQTALLARDKRPRNHGSCARIRFARQPLGRTRGRDWRCPDAFGDAHFRLRRAEEPRSVGEHRAHDHGGEKQLSSIG